MLEFGVPGTSIRIFFHDQCFDGATSAALLGQYFRQTQGESLEIDYWGMAHSSGDPFAGVPWDADINACVDFRYSPDPRMHWWFDHHQSAFQPPALREHFEAHRSKTKFFDPHARSCSLYAYRILTEELGFQLDDPEGHWRDVLEWADRIDGAVFSSAREIVEREAPALQLMTWLRHNRDGEKMAMTIETLGRRSMLDVIALPWIAEELPALLRAHRESVAVIEKRLVRRGAVATYDLSEDDVVAPSGFAVYMLEPQATYSVGLTCAPGVGPSISVGCNPWSRQPAVKNIADICERHGGGGHPNVGGIQVPDGDVAKARSIVDSVVDLLNA